MYLFFPWLFLCLAGFLVPAVSLAALLASRRRQGAWWRRWGYQTSMLVAWMVVGGALDAFFVWRFVRG